jgi:hypothetical protein
MLTTNIKIDIGIYEKSRCRDRMVVGFTTTYAINVFHH